MTTSLQCFRSSVVRNLFDDMTGLNRMSESTARGYENQIRIIEALEAARIRKRPSMVRLNGIQSISELK